MMDKMIRLEDDAAEQCMPPPPIDEQSLLRELAALSPLAYDRRRKDAAQQLGVGVSALDKTVNSRNGTDRGVGTELLFEDVAPWDEPVTGDDLLRDLADTLRRYIVLPEDADVAMALWIEHAHCHDASQVSALLAIQSPQKRCGKTTALMVLNQLVPRPLPSANITSAALFRTCEKWKSTLLIDEADSFLRDNEQMRGILNSGHNRGAAFIVRTTGDDHEPVTFCTWAPKAIALIGNLPATLQDRSIIVSLRRRRKDETVRRFRPDVVDDEHLTLRRKCVRWTADNMTALALADPNMPGELHDRAADNWRPLLAIADAAGGEWPELARRAAVALSGNADDSESLYVELLRDIQAIFADQQADQLPSARLVDLLAAMEDRPWAEYRRGKPITTNQLARALRPFGIWSNNMRMADAKVRKGYALKDFADAFSRYTPPIPPYQTATTLQPTATASFSQFQTATQDNVVADQKSPKPAATGACSVVADRAPERPIGGMGAVAFGLTEDSE